MSASARFLNVVFCFCFSFQVATSQRLWASSNVNIEVELLGQAPANTAELPVFAAAVPLTTISPERSFQRVVTRLSLDEATPLELTPGVWIVTAYAKGYWGTSAEVTVPEGGDAIRLHLWPAGVISGSLSEQSERPDRLRISFESSFSASGNDSTRPSGQSVCSLEDGSFRCVIPAGVMNARLHSQGFISAYVWDVAVIHDADTPVGAIHLERGSSLVGFVEGNENEENPVDLASVRLELRSLDGTPVGGNEGPSRKPITVTPNKHGFWQFRHPPVGEFYVVAQAEGLNEAIRRVHVFDQRETILRSPLKLARTANLEVFVDPPVDPNGGRWKIDLVKREGSHAERIQIASPQVGEDGYFETPLVEGTYHLTLTSHSMGKVHHQFVEFSSRSDPVYIAVNFVRVTGRLRLGSRPLQGTVSFGGTRGAVSIHMDSDSRGRFVGLLPRSGLWRVEVNSGRPPLRRFLEQVDVSPDVSGKAFVEIELPDTYLSGVVADEQGQIPAKGIVMAVRLGHRETPVTDFTDSAGEFEFRGLSPGSYVLSAQAAFPAPGRFESDAVTVDVADSTKTPGELRLIVRRTTTIRGRVVSVNGPVPNASILARPVGEYGVGVVTVSTDPTGAFELNVRRPTQELIVNAWAPGYAFRIFRATVTPGASLEIPLVRDGGSISIPLRNSGVEPDVSTLNTLVLFHGNASAGMATLRQWAGMNRTAASSGRFVIPQMEPGDYRLCQMVGPRSQTSLAPDEEQTCSTGTLLGGGELLLGDDLGTQ